MHQYRNELLLLSAAFFWGGSFILIQGALSSIPAYLFIFMRFLTALVVSLPFLLVYGTGFKELTSDLFPGFITGTVLFAAYALQTVGLQYTSPANSAFITGLNVLLIPLLGAIFFRIQLSGGYAVYLPLAAAGFYLLTYHRTLSINYGDLFTLFCAAAIALQVLFVDKYLKEGKTPHQLIFGQLLWVAVWAGTFSLLHGESIQSQPALLYVKLPLIDCFIKAVPASYSIATVLFTGILCSAWGFAAQTIGQRTVPPVRVGLIFLMEPVFGALLDWTLNGMPTGKKLLGALLILSALLAAELDLFGNGKERKS